MVLRYHMQTAQLISPIQRFYTTSKDNYPQRFTQSLKSRCAKYSDIQTKGEVSTFLSGYWSKYSDLFYTSNHQIKRMNIQPQFVTMNKQIILQIQTEQIIMVKKERIIESIVKPHSQLLNKIRDLCFIIQKTSLSSQTKYLFRQVLTQSRNRQIQLHFDSFGYSFQFKKFESLLQFVNQILKAIEDGTHKQIIALSVEKFIVSGKYLIFSQYTHRILTERFIKQVRNYVTMNNSNFSLETKQFYHRFLEKQFKLWDNSLLKVNHFSYRFSIVTRKFISQKRYLAAKVLSNKTIEHKKIRAILYYLQYTTKQQILYLQATLANMQHISNGKKDLSYLLMEITNNKDQGMKNNQSQSLLNSIKKTLQIALKRMDFDQSIIINNDNIRFIKIEQLQAQVLNEQNNFFVDIQKTRLKIIQSEKE